ncbi:hypothetical protein ARMGADRAFT_1025742 [Armillaria gallica]|uniref:Uncharacterized protein n=1 Tax=Armillaria gallica TaxID=47427 RepID=A0A2H3DWI2_ARMGA|nr:hypothetical protein ARMGADRAFT_1025742 [Armillaria gallica]
MAFELMPIDDHIPLLTFILRTHQSSPPWSFPPTDSIPATLVSHSGIASDPSMQSVHWYQKAKIWCEGVGSNKGDKCKRGNFRTRRGYTEKEEFTKVTMKAVHYRWPMAIKAVYSALHDRNSDQKAGRQGKETRREPK